MNRDRTCLFGDSFEVTTLSKCHREYKDVKSSFHQLPLCLRSYTSSELESRYSLSKISILGSNQMGLNLGNKLVVECHVLIGNSTRGGSLNQRLAITSDALVMCVFEVDKICSDTVTRSS
ncbi:hypothetical protein AVEN_50404-1 [Araneus ventricosus]|uniref:Uncharacterized protein n=1 Tax=Araneus ventricosus TaxID=182803 RepID=A0A4Y2X5P7_ARAVE|nr:hypothetical protein AVEN_42373-1 [Araneus ventricosus]GBO44819.1 hypothetical protein AVEN_50404-1 [Araneus ventricosus]